MYCMTVMTLINILLSIVIVILSHLPSVDQRNGEISQRQVIYWTSSEGNLYFCVLFYLAGGL